MIGDVLVLGTSFFFGWARTCQVRPSAPGEVMKCDFHPSFLWCPYLWDTAPPSPPKVHFPSPPPGQRYPHRALYHAHRQSYRLAALCDPQAAPNTPTCSCLSSRAPSLEGVVERLIICLDVFVLWIYSSFCPPCCLLKFLFLSISFTWVGALSSKADFSTRLHPCHLNNTDFSFSPYHFLFCCSGTGAQSSSNQVFLSRLHAESTDFNLLTFPFRQFPTSSS